MLDAEGAGLPEAGDGAGGVVGEAAAGSVSLTNSRSFGEPGEAPHRSCLPWPQGQAAGRVGENAAAARLVRDSAALDLLEPLADQVMGEGGY